MFNFLVFTEITINPFFSPSIVGFSIARSLCSIQYGFFSCHHSFQHILLLISLLCSESLFLLRLSVALCDFPHANVTSFHLLPVCFVGSFAFLYQCNRFNNHNNSRAQNTPETIDRIWQRKMSFSFVPKQFAIVHFCNVLISCDCRFHADVIAYFLPTISPMIVFKSGFLFNESRDDNSTPRLVWYLRQKIDNLTPIGRFPKGMSAEKHRSTSESIDVCIF